jgi:putative ABC transport system permease protein
MSTALRDRPAPAPRAGTADGGVPARRAVFRWAWRLFRRELRQQLLVLGLLTLAVAATILGVAVAASTPGSPGAATFGSANTLITLPGQDPHLASDIAAIRQRLGPADVIENQNLSTGLVQPIQLRAQDPAGPYGGPTLALVSGHYPAGPGQAALTSQVATLYGVHTGDTWRAGGHVWRVVGVVENPSNLLDEFALVAPGQISAPTEVTILVQAGDGTVSGPGGGTVGGPDAGNAIPASSLPSAATVSYRQSQSGQISPATVVLVVAVLGLIFIGLVATAGYTVMAQRRLRALGMLSALGATERNVRLVMVANGAIVGVAATLLGAVLGFAAWFAYAPHLQTATAHRIDPANLPWWAIVTGMVLAIATSVLAARRPARSVARLPVVAALSGRPAPPKAVHRSALPGVGLLAAGAAMLAFSGGWSGNSGPQSLLLLAGLVAMILGCLLLAPLCVGVLAVAARYAPVTVRLALRDLARYRARSGAALAAVSFAVFLAVMISVVASVRFSNVLDYTGPNLTANQLIVYTANDPQNPGATPSPAASPAQLNALNARVNSLAASLHATSVLALDSAASPAPAGRTAGGPAGGPGPIPGATLQQASTQNNNYSGALYVATPALLAQYGIKPSEIKPGTDILSVRPGLAAEPRMMLVWGDYFTRQNQASGCPAASCVAGPAMQTFSQLPSGTSAPNTVLTMQAVRALKLQLVPDGWLIETAHPLTAVQINAARQLALSQGTTVETKSGALGLTQISDGATAAGILIALGVLAMSIGLIRSETAGDRRTLTAAGASARARRTITGATAGALALLGALLGTAVAALAGVAWARSSLSTTFGHIPARDILIILVGLPLVAVIGGWLLAGREPPVISRQPLE